MTCQTFLRPIIAASLLLTVAAPSPARAADTTKVVMQLDWIFNAQFAGLYQAIEQGYFAEEGLDVELRESVPDQNTVGAVLDADIAFGCAESNVLLLDRADGADIVALGAMFQRSPLVWMYLPPTQYTGTPSLKGKRVGVNPDGKRVMKRILKGADVSLEEVEIMDVGYDKMQPLLDGKVDFIQGYYIDEFVRLQMQTGGQAQSFLAEDYGYSAYSQVVFASAAQTQAHPDLYPRFERALARGWLYALIHQQETVDLILKKYNPDLDPVYQQRSLARIADLVTPAGHAPMQPMQRKVWADNVAFFMSEGILKEPVDLDAMLPTTAPVAVSSTAP
ncbi:MAG: ABC transporter substrate-binding protein [Opitutales bacterium]